jgi:hypothetical protein
VRGWEWDEDVAVSSCSLLAKSPVRDSGRVQPFVERDDFSAESRETAEIGSFGFKLT